MNIKSLLLGSAAALVAVSGARAADAIVAAEPEPVEYVRVCDAFGTGYFYIPGTETCLQISGYIRVDTSGGELFERTSASGDETYNMRSRVSVRTRTASETELGTLRTYSELRFQWDTQNRTNNVNAGNSFVRVSNGYETDNAFSVNFAWIQLGGLRIGKDESMFTTFTGYAGNVINDGVIFDPGPFDTNLVSYTYNGGAFSASLALEQGDDSLLSTNLSVPALVTTTTATGWGIDDYLPHVVAGIGYTAGMFEIRGVIGFDSRDDLLVGGATVLRGGVSGKIRADVTINDQASVFAMLHYGENASAYTTWRDPSAPANGETFAVSAGASYQINEKATFNMQGQWRESNTVGNSDAWSLVGNVAYELVPGLILTPEIAYRDNGTVDGDAFGGFFRVQRSF